MALGQLQPADHGGILTTMKPTPFDPARDYAPIPFEPAVLEAARRLKAAGLQWRPHVGCFAWDPDGYMPVPSPFPERVYFVLNLGRFTEILGSVEAMQERLVWVPTWTQASALLAAAATPGAAANPVAAANPAATRTPGAAALLALYARLEAALDGPGGSR